MGQIILHERKPLSIPILLLIALTIPLLFILTFFYNANYFQDLGTEFLKVLSLTFFLHYFSALFITSLLIGILIYFFYHRLPIAKPIGGADIAVYGVLLALIIFVVVFFAEREILRMNDFVKEHPPIKVSDPN